MKRSGFKHRTKPIRQRRREGADVERSDKPWAVALASATLRPLTPGRIGGSTSGVAVEKTEAYRDPALLEMARGRPCLLLVPGACTHRVDQTVACHSNLSIHGKAGARKADDCYSVHGCAGCHSWLDQGKAPATQKEVAFMAAHARQVLAWRVIAADPGEPARFRRAACRALERLNAST